MLDHQIADLLAQGFQLETRMIHLAVVVRGWERNEIFVDEFGDLHVS